MVAKKSKKTSSTTRKGQFRTASGKSRHSGPSTEAQSSGGTAKRSKTALRRKHHARSAPRRQPQGDPLPVTPTVSRLPLGDREIGWRKFEEFCRALVSALPGVASCIHYGKQGDKQRGIDLVATMRDGSTVTYQCRQVAKFGTKDMERAIEDTDYKAARHVVLTSAEAGAGARDVISRQRGKWSLWDIDDISRQTRELSPEDAVRIVRGSFGAPWVPAFLGVGGLAAFRSSENSLAPFLDPSRVFNHTHAMVARSAALQDLLAFTQGSREKIAVVSGAGGTGKTKLLLELSRQLAVVDDRVKVLRVEESVPIAETTIAQVPTGRVVLIVDDAHRRDDIGPLLALARQRSDVRLVLVTRPHAVERLRNELRYASFAAEDVAGTVTLKKLSQEDTLAIVESILGPEFKGERIAERIAELSDGSPLVATIAAALVRDREVAPEMVQNDEVFVSEVFSRFEDALLGHVTTEASERRFLRQLLPAIAALSPLSIEDGELVDAIAAHLDVKASDVHLALATLETSGVLVRSGTTVRITPDVLSDHVLARQSVTAAKASTGYPAEVVSAFGLRSIGAILRNFSELDWRLRRSESRAQTGVEEVWAFFEDRFERADPATRSALLGVLEDVAYYQPAAALRFVRALRCVGDGEMSSSVADRCARILEKCAYTIDHIGECVALLLAMMESDVEREPARRVLCKLAEYQIGKPYRVQELVLSGVEQRLTTHPMFIENALPIAKALLAKTGSSMSAGRRQFTITAFGVLIEPTRSIRAGARRIYQQGLASSSARVRRVALETAYEDAAPPMMTYARVPSESEEQAWESERLSAIQSISDALSQSSDAEFHVAIRSKVRWLARHGPKGPIRDNATKIRNRISRSFEHRLIWVLRGDIHDGDADDFCYERDVAALAAAARNVAAAYLKTYPDATIGCAELERRLVVLQEWQSASPHAFIEALLELDATYAVKLMASALTSNARATLSWLASVVASARASDPSGVADLVRAAIAGDEGARRAIAVSLRGAPNDLRAEEVRNWRRLLRDESAAVRHDALSSLKWLVSSRKTLAVNLAMRARYEVNDASGIDLVDELCSVIHELRDAELTDRDVDKVLAIVQRANSLRGYWTREFVGRAFARRPFETLRMLVARIEAERQSTEFFEALPFDGLAKSLEGLRGRPELPSLLRDVIKVGREPTRFYGGASRLFRDIATVDMELTKAELRAFVGNSDGDVLYASSLVALIPSVIIVAHGDLLKDLLLAAESMGSAVSERVEVTLRNALIPSRWSSTVGKPDPHHVRVMEKAREVADRMAKGSAERAMYEAAANEISRAIEDHIKGDDDD